jgi:hypothetical protein
MNQRRLVVSEIDLQPRSVCMIHDSLDCSVDNSASVHVDLDAVANREIIYVSFGLSFLAGFFFASILFLPRPVESRTFPDVVGPGALSERPYAELPARTPVAPRRTSFRGVPVVRQH